MVQLCGPWVLAATLELPRTLNVAIADPGAVADLTASLAEGVGRPPDRTGRARAQRPVRRAVRRAGPGRRGRRPGVDRERLAQVIASTGAYTVVHSCSTAVPFGIIRERQEVPADARRRHVDLSLEITEADHRYYVLDSPTISDIEYDTKMRELRALEDEYPGPAHARLADADGARHRVHAVHSCRAPGAAAPDTQSGWYERLREWGLPVSGLYQVVPDMDGVRGYIARYGAPARPALRDRRRGSEGGSDRAAVPARLDQLGAPLGHRVQVPARGGHYQAARHPGERRADRAGSPRSR